VKAIELQHIKFKYPKGDLVFDDFSVDFNKGDFIFLLGANGSGKSSLLKLILGAVKPKKGAVLFAGNQIDSVQTRSKLIGYIPQSYGLDHEMYVTDIIDFIGSLHDLSRQEFKERKSFLINALGLDHIIDKKVKKLSGGQKQLVNIALGLIHNPDILLIDEPFVGLDYGIKSKIISFLNAIKKTIICVSHDIEMAENNATKILLINKGVIQDYRSPSEIIASNPYYLEEIDFKEAIDFDAKLDDEISSVKHHNRLIVSCPNRIELIDKIKVFKEEFSAKIASTRYCENNLQSTLVGFNKLSLAEKEGGKKGKGNKKRKK
jgi:ABC-type multidrug transport system ATPase subunit